MMRANSQTAPATAPRRWLRRGARPQLGNAFWLVPAPLVAIAAAAQAGLSPWPTGVLAAVVTSGVLAAFRQTANGATFGLANGVTLVRLNLTAFLLVASAAVLIADTLEPRLHWTVFAAAAVALLMDGVDGWLARRRREASTFGERFDMAADTAFTIILTISLVAFGLAGFWVLAIGLLRPLFVVLARWRPALAAPLPPSRLRKVLCAAALCLMVAALAPPLAAASPLLAAAALVTLIGSFVRDIRHLVEVRYA